MKTITKSIVGLMIIGLVIALLLGIFMQNQPIVVQAQDDAALVWQVGGQPGQTSGLGTLFWQSGSGIDPAKLADVPDEGGGTLVFPCGPDAVMADGSAMMAYIGREVGGPERGGLYRVGLQEGGELTRLADVHALACIGRGMATFSPNGSRWAYLDYPADVTRTSVFAYGDLHVLSVPDGALLDSAEDIVAFDLRDDGAYVVEFFTDGQGKADEAAVFWWTGEGVREWAAFEPAEDCQWTSAAVAATPAGDTVAVSLGETCENIGSQWRLFSVTQDGVTTEHVNMPAGGRYLPHVTDNQLYYLPDGQHVLATVPDGSGRTVNLVLAALAENTVTLVSENVMVDALPGGRSYNMQLSPDGKLLAFVSKTPNNENAIHRLSLDGSYEPLTLSAGARNDEVSSFAFRPDNGLVYIAGGVDGRDNSMMLLPVTATEPQRLTRGEFLRDNLVVTDDVALALNFIAPDDDYKDPAADLLRVSNEGMTAVVVDGRQSVAVAHPLWWR
ncbi:TolB family protein [Chloroflexota bacterium]